MRKGESIWVRANSEVKDDDSERKRREKGGLGLQR